MSIRTKCCSTCKIEKPVTDFPKNKSSTDGYRSDCTKCHGASSRRSVRKGAEKLELPPKRNHLKIALFKWLSGKEHPSCMAPNCMPTKHFPSGSFTWEDIQLGHINGDGAADRAKFEGNDVRLVKYYLCHPQEAKKKVRPECSWCNWRTRNT